MNHDEGWKVFAFSDWLIWQSIIKIMFIDFDRESIQKRKVPLGKITVVQLERKSRVSLLSRVTPLRSLPDWWRTWAKSAVRASWQPASEFLYNRACNTHYSKLTKDSKNKRKTFSNVIFTWERFSKYEKPRERFWEIFTRTLSNTQIRSPNFSAQSVVQVDRTPTRP